MLFIGKEKNITIEHFIPVLIFYYGKNIRTTKTHTQTDINNRKKIVDIIKSLYRFFTVYIGSYIYGLGAYSPSASYMAIWAQDVYMRFIHYI